MQDYQCIKWDGKIAHIADAHNPMQKEKREKNPKSKETEKLKKKNHSFNTQAWTV
jgi:hypothetical protein